MPLPEGFQKWADTYFPKLKSQQSVLMEQMSLAADRMKDRLGQDDESGGGLDPDREEAEHEFAWLDDDAKVTPETFEPAYNRLKPRVDDVLHYPEKYASDALKREQQAVKALHDQVTSDQKRGDLNAASQSLDKLRAAVASAQKVLRPHDKEMHAYYRELKALQPRIDYAKKIHGASDMATKPWKAEAEAFDTKKGEVVAAQNARTYKDARARLGELKLSIDALMDKRLASLSAAKTASTTSARKTKEYVDQLRDEEVAYLPAKEKVALLETLRTKRGNLSDESELKARCKILRNMKMNPEFEKQDKKNRALVVNKLLDSPKFKEAEANWATWSTTQDGVEKQKAFLLEAAKLQCEVLGHPMPTIVFERQRKCAGGTGDHDDEAQPADGCGTCNGRLPGSTTFAKASPVAPACNHCGSTDYDDFGYDEGCCGSPPDDAPYTPASININTVPESSFGNFQEVLDSLMHENAHAYQMHLVYDRLGVPPLTDPGPAPDQSDPDYDEHMKKQTAWRNRLQPGDRKTLQEEWDQKKGALLKQQEMYQQLPSTKKQLEEVNAELEKLEQEYRSKLEDADLYDQAMMFYENELAYVGPEDSGRVDNRQTYMKEPLEDHAWSFGPAVARQALIRRKRDLDSRRVLKEEYVEIAGITKANPLVVRLKARHGVGEDAKVQVSGVKGMKQINGKTLKVDRAVNDFELALDGDSTGWNSYAKGGRIRVVEWSRDLK